ncbi:MAG: SurA N-terminal domain-containing protein, partial [Gammaproteobacteria bacterium]|nr:SurA N-terminal domain-containing protein [Gammaproteobacteria bacterium]
MTRSGTLSVLCLALCALLVSIPAAGQKVLLDKVIAIVDEDVVLQSELDARRKSIREQAQQNNQPLPGDDELSEEVLEVLVMENLQMQMANRMSIRFDDDTINGVLSNMAAGANMSFDDYVSVMEENGDYLETRNEIRKQITLQDLQRGVVNRRITITDQEIDNFLDSDAGKEYTAADYFVDDILISTSASDTNEVTSAKL